MKNEQATMQMHQWNNEYFWKKGLGRRDNLIIIAELIIMGGAAENLYSYIQNMHFYVQIVDLQTI